MGTYPSTCSGGADSNYTISYVGGTEHVQKAVLHVTANSYSRTYHLANPLLNAQLSGFVNGDGASSVSGVPSCSTTATISSPVSTYPITCITGTLAAANYSFAFLPGVLTVTVMPTSLSITSSATLSSGGVKVTASLVEQLTGAAIPGETVTFVAGAATGSGISNPASATLSLANGRYVLGASFAGDNNYSASSASQTLIAYQPSSFVVWGGNAGGVQVGADLNFWGAQWSSQVISGNYSAGSSFKGFANAVSTDGTTWTSPPGNSSQPPASVGQYIGVIVSTSATKSGNTISGNIAKVVILKVDDPSAYASDPGHPASGVVQTTVS